jgi:MFS family permease
MSPTFSALSIRNYRMYFTGMLASNTGTWMQRVAQDWLVLSLSEGSGASLGITIGLQFVPVLLFSLVGGTLADRWRRRSLLMTTQALMGALALSLGALTLTGHVTVPIVYGFSLALGVVSAIDNPSRQAFVGEMVGRDRLTNAVALNSASFNLGRIVGPSIAGLLIAAIGTGWVFMLNGVSFVIAIIALSMIRSADLVAPNSGGDRNSVRLSDGFAYLRARADLVLVLLIVLAVGTFGFNFQLTLALMAQHEFGGTAAEFGIFSSALAVGALCGSLLAARRGAPRLSLVCGAALTFALFETASALMPNPVAFALFLPLVGVAALTFSNAAQSYIQLGTAPRMRGRVMGFYMLVFFGGTPIGAPLLGILADHAGARWTLALGGLGVMATTIIFSALLWKRAQTAAARSRHDTDLADIPVPTSVRPTEAKSVTSAL